jgi:hypothetical protein
LLQQRSRFTVVLRDSYGTRLRKGGDKVRASSRGPGPLRPSVADEGDGSYTVTYLATVSGTYALSLSVNAAPLVGSPLEIAVEPSVAHAPSCLADGSGLRLAVAGEPTSFFVRAHDEFGRPKIMGGERFDAMARYVGGLLPTPSSPAKAALSSSPQLSPRDAERRAYLVSSSPLGEANGTLSRSAAPSVPPTAKSPGVVTRNEYELPILMSDLGNGSYEGRYTVRYTGQYELRVERDGVPIGGSPFALRVVSGPSDPASCTLSGEGVRVAEAGVPSSFQLLARDRFGNARRAQPLVKTNGMASEDAFDATLVPLRLEHPSAPIKCRVVPTPDGDAYEVQYTACAAGEYEVRVGLRGDYLSSRPTLTILPTKTSAAASTAEGEGLLSAVAGSRATFTIVARDRFGNARDCEEDIFEVAIRLAGRPAGEGADSADAEDDFGHAGWERAYGEDAGAIVGEVYRQADGTAAAVLVPRTSGLGCVDVTLGGEHIRGSPFSTRVSGGPPTASASSVSGTGARTAVAGELTAFVVHARDSFGNHTAQGEPPTVRVWPGADADVRRPAHVTAPDGALTMSDNGAWSPARSPLAGSPVGVHERLPPVSAAVVPVGEGKYSASYTVETAGEYLLEVRIGRELIVGAPFRLSVVAGAAHPPSCRLLRAGPAAVTAGQTALVRFEACDKRGNRCTEGGEPFEVHLTVDPTAGIELPAIAEAAEEAAAAADALAADADGGAAGTDAEAVAAGVLPDVNPAVTARRRQQQVPPTPTLLDELSGMYTLGYGWSRAGALKLTIKLHGLHIGGSPLGLAVLPDEPHAAHCVPYGLHLKTSATDTPLRIGVLLRDRFGNPCEQSPHGVALVLRGPAEVHGELEHVRRGAEEEVTAVAAVTIAGRYWAHLSLHGHPIGGSPYLITVRPSAASAAASSIWGDGLHTAMAGVPAYFAVQLKDALGNATADGVEELTARVTTPSVGARIALPAAPSADDEATGALAGDGSGGDAAVGSRGVPECSLYHAYDHAPLKKGGAGAGGGGGGGEADGANGAALVAQSGLGDGSSSPGLLSGVWRTLTAGRHYLHIQLRGEPLPGSPFPITVLGGHTHAGSSTLYRQAGAADALQPGELVLCQVLARDRWGNLRGEGGDDFHVHVRGGARPTVQELRDLGSGEYELRLVLPLSGDFWLHVTHQKLHLNGSPMRINVASPGGGGGGAGGGEGAADTDWHHETGMSSPRLPHPLSGRATHNGGPPQGSSPRRSTNPASPRQLGGSPRAVAPPRPPTGTSAALMHPGPAPSGLMGMLSAGVLELPSPREPRSVPRPYPSPGAPADPKVGVTASSAAPAAAVGGSPRPRPGGSGLPGRVEELGVRGVRSGAVAGSSGPLSPRGGSLRASSQSTSPRQPWRAGVASAMPPPPPPAAVPSPPQQHRAPPAPPSAAAVTRLSYAALPTNTRVRSVALGEGLHRAAAGAAASFSIVCRDSSGRTLRPPDPSVVHLALELPPAAAVPLALPPSSVPREAPGTPAPEVHMLSSQTSADGAALLVSYMVRRAGNALLHVCLDTTPVHGSPFTVSVQPGPTAASTSSAQGAGLVHALVGVEAAFVVTAFDAFGNRKHSGGDRFQARLIGDADGKPVSRCELIDCEDGTYLSLFTPDAAAAGKSARLHVTIGDVPIQGSPFAVTIRAA